MNNAKQIPTLAKICQRHLSQVVEKPSPRFHKLRKIQERFQIEDGTPVYLKGGVFDKLLYGGTSFLTLIGLGLSLETWYKITFKKS